MSKRSAKKKEIPSPDLLLVRMVVAEDGTLTVTVDGAPYLPPEFSPPWRRASFPHIVDAISQQYGQTLRIDVVETDGRVVTDFRTPPAPRRVPPPTQSPAPQSPAPAPATPGPLLQFAGSGFIPGEDVAVAIVIAHTDASPEQIARTLIDPRYFTNTPTGEAVLLGRISGMCVVGKPA